MRSFTPSRHLKNLAPPIPTLRRKISVFRYSPATLRGEASKAAVFDGCSQPCSIRRPAGDAALTTKMKCRPEKEGRAGSLNVQCTLLTHLC